MGGVDNSLCVVCVHHHIYQYSGIHFHKRVLKNIKLTPNTIATHTPYLLPKHYREGCLLKFFIKQGFGKYSQL